MPEVIISASGVQHGLIVNPDGTIGISGTFSADLETIFLQSGNALFGYPTNEVIRKSSGSPAVDYVFSSLVQAFSIDNLGSSPIYFALDSTANPAAGSTGFINSFNFRSFDGQVGSISIQGSGTTGPEIQVIGLS